MVHGLGQGAGVGAGWIALGDPHATPRDIERHRMPVSVHLLASQPPGKVRAFLAVERSMASLTSKSSATPTTS
jgi:hypothetical protein